MATGQNPGNSGSASEAAVTRIAAAAITSRFALVASTSAPAGVCAAMPAKARDRHHHADPRLVPVLFGQKVNGEIGPKPVADVGEGEIGGVQGPVRPPFWIAALRHRYSVVMNADEKREAD